MMALVCDKCGWNIVDNYDFAIKNKCDNCKYTQLIILKGSAEEVNRRINDINMRFK
jgi:hypothetical protein